MPPQPPKPLVPLVPSRMWGGSRVVHTERELAEALADPTLSAVAVAATAGTGEPLQVIAPVSRPLWVSGHTRVQIGGGSWIEVHADGHAHVEAWDGRIHATGTAQFLARGRTQVYAGDRASGTAIDAARVVALDDAELTADGAAVIRAADRARVRAGGAVYIEATGSVRVHAGPHVVVRRYSPEAVITGPGTVLDSTDLDPTAPAFGPSILTLLPPPHHDRDPREPT